MSADFFLSSHPRAVSRFHWSGVFVLVEVCGMDNNIIFLAIGVGVVALLLIANYVAVRRQERRDTIGLMSPPTAYQAPVTDPAVSEIARTDPEIVRAYQRGNKIEAIKVLRQRTGIGLAEAKQIIEAHEAQYANMESVPPIQTADLTAVTRDPELIGYMQQGRKIDAIRRYRQLTNVGLKEAKDAVEQIMGG